MIAALPVHKPRRYRWGLCDGRAEFTSTLGDLMSDASRLPTHLRDFVDSETWTFAKTMPKWPHEYLVRDGVDVQLFEELVHHIRLRGREGRFYDQVFVYFEEDGLLYWTMGAPVGETVIINRCKTQESYESRLNAGTLPEDSAS